MTPSINDTDKKGKSEHRYKKGVHEFINDADAESQTTNRDVAESMPTVGCLTFFERGVVGLLSLTVYVEMLVDGTKSS